MQSNIKFFFDRSNCEMGLQTQTKPDAVSSDTARPS